jgi:uncharacterized membrane protein YfcA
VPVASNPSGIGQECLRYFAELAFPSSRQYHRLVVQLWHFPILFATAFAAGFVDSIAGGGGLITMPALLSLGLDPKVALGTNKLQALFGSGSATWHYSRAGVAPLSDCRRGFLFTFLGAAIGSSLALMLSRELLLRIIPVLLLLVAVFVIFRPKLGEGDIHPRMSRGMFDVCFGLLLGGYDGFFGPGTGTFWAMAFMAAQGFNLTKATGYTKVMNFASNVSSFLCFMVAGQALVLLGLVMGAGQLLGARAGSRMVIRKGARFIRPVFLAVVLALAMKLMWDAYWR